MTQQRDVPQPRVKVIACGVFERELDHLASSRVAFDRLLLDAGLHSSPERLHRELQAAIDGTPPGAYDALALLYGLCGRAAVGLVARETPLVVPRVHDCIALFLGDAEVWRQQFRACPGTLYLTPGWCEKDAHPDRQRLEAAQHAWTAAQHPSYDLWAAQYGDGNAAWIADFLQSWRRNYQRIALIHNGLGDVESYRASARDLAAAVGWRFEELPGQLGYVTDLLRGPHDEARFLVVPPRHRLVATHDARLMAAVPDRPGERPQLAAAALQRVRVTPDDAKPAEQQGLGLGVDAGGTFTDAVLLDLAAGQVLSKAKAPTTHHDLALAVADAVGRLDTARFGEVRLVALSTTLATNAIVEGRGAKVGLLLMPWNARSLEQIEAAPVAIVPGRLNIDGEEVDPVDAAAVRATVEAMLAEGVEAFAVSGYAGTHNPVHELAVKAAVRAVADVPVVCGHELSSRLDFIRRAHTAVLNARLLPTISDLLDAVGATLDRFGIQAPVFVVRGDGSLIEVAAARERPIETLLSGPAASACGARFLTGADDLLAVDIGGTTTDIAIVQDGRVGLCEEGPTVGAWRTSVNAVDILTSGLGGDSHLRLADGGLRLTIGPGRVTPLSSLAARWTEVGAELAEVAARSESEAVPALAIDFLELVQVRARTPLSDREQAMVQHLRRGPASLATLAAASGALAMQTLATERLESLGIVRRASLTPTDVLHVLGRFDGFDTAAARHALTVVARAAGREPAELAEWAQQCFVRRLAWQVMRRELSVELGDPAASSDPLLERLLDAMLEPEAAAPFALRFAERRLVVGIGAPAAEFLPPAGALLDATVVVPEHAEVANAIGAVTGKVTVRAAVHIRPDATGAWLLWSAHGRGEYADLSEARDAARDLLVNVLRQRAATFGTAEQTVTVDFVSRTGRLSDGSDQLIELRAEGLLEGAPRTGD